MVTQRYDATFDDNNAKLGNAATPLLTMMAMRTMMTKVVAAVVAVARTTKTAVVTYRQQSTYVLI